MDEDEPSEPVERVEGRWVLFSNIERKGWSFQTGYKEGFREGLAEGRQEALREQGLRFLLRRSIVDFLELRGFALSPALRERIAACEVVGTLERWYEAAKTAPANQPVDQIQPARSSRARLPPAAVPWAWAHCAGTP
jgi:hypothetical protein